jgi:hypothetical protein
MRVCGGLPMVWLVHVGSTARLDAVVFKNLHKSDCVLQGAWEVIDTMHVVVLELEYEIAKAGRVRQPEEQITHKVASRHSLDSRFLIISEVACRRQLQGTFPWLPYC